MAFPNLLLPICLACILQLFISAAKQEPPLKPEWGFPNFLTNFTTTISTPIPERSSFESPVNSTIVRTANFTAVDNNRRNLATADAIIMPFSGFNFPYLNWPLNLAAATVSQGNISALSLALLRLQERRCLNIVILGGSISAGSSVENEKVKQNGVLQPKGMSGAWPAWLKKYLDVYFPDCESTGQVGNGRQESAGSGHVIHDLAVKGQASDSWTLMVAEALFDKETTKFGAQLFSADLIFVETSVNDVASLGARHVPLKSTAPGNHHDGKVGLSQVHTEILINQLNSLPKSPSLMFVGASERALWIKPNEKPSVVQMVEAQSIVTRYYGIPYISAMHALGPLNTAYKQNWFLNIYRCDNCCHLSTIGHRFVATLIMRHLVQRFVDTAKNGPANGVWPNYRTSSTYDDLRKETKNSFLDNALRQRIAARKQPPAPLLFSSRTDLDVMLHASPLTIDAVRQHPLSSTGDWAVYEDVRGKPGLIGTKIGASVTFGFDALTCKERIIAGLLKLQLLKSYNKMGTMRLRLYSIPSSKAADCRSAAAAAIASGSGGLQSKTSTAVGTDLTIDCLWDTRASVTVVETLKFPTSFTGSLCINVTVTNSTQARVENKIKLLSITLM